MYGVKSWLTVDMNIIVRTYPLRMLRRGVRLRTILVICKDLSTLKVLTRPFKTMLDRLGFIQLQKLRIKSNSSTRHPEFTVISSLNSPSPNIYTAQSI